MKHLIDVTLAGLTFSCALRFPETAVFPPVDPAAPRAGGDPVCLSREDWDYYCGIGSLPSPQAEFSLLTAAFSDTLMDFDRLILHGVALRWRDKAWLICGAPGVGKSTQARFLRELRPGEFGIICGDRPILQFCHSAECRDAKRSSAAFPRHCEPVTALPAWQSASPVPVGAELEESREYDHIGPPASPVPSKPSPSGEGVTTKAVTDEGQILVHPSPWNGKEDWHGAEAAPLAGLILLERGEENRLVSLTEREAAVPVYTQVIQTTAQEARIRQSAALITRLLKVVPVWRLTTHQVPDSTKLLLESVFSP